MTGLDQWREMAREENARMRKVCFGENDGGHSPQPSEAVAQRRARVWAMYQGGMTTRAIAEAEGVPQGTVKSDLASWRRCVVEQRRE